MDDSVKPAARQGRSARPTSRNPTFPAGTKAPGFPSLKPAGDCRAVQSLHFVPTKPTQSLAPSSCRALTIALWTSWIGAHGDTRATSHWHRPARSERSQSSSTPRLSCSAMAFPWARQARCSALHLDARRCNNDTGLTGNCSRSSTISATMPRKPWMAAEKSA